MHTQITNTQVRTATVDEVHEPSILLLGWKGHVVVACVVVFPSDRVRRLGLG